jgi:hypothetical protein
MQVFALLTTAMLAATGSPGALRHVVASTHVQFDLPHSLTYQKQGQGDAEAHVAHDQSRVVSVAVKPSLAALVSCDPTVGADVRGGRTKRGLDTCTITASSADGDTRLSTVLVLVDTPAGIAFVSAVAPEMHDAQTLAIAVADTVHVDPVTAAQLRGLDDRMVGCFTSSQSPSARLSVVDRRCFGRDRTFTSRTLMRSQVLDMSNTVSNGYYDGSDTGTWVVRGNTLYILFSNGEKQTWKVRFTGAGDVIADEDQFWSRAGSAEEEVSVSDSGDEALEDEDGDDEDSLAGDVE